MHAKFRLYSSTGYGDVTMGKEKSEMADGSRICQGNRIKFGRTQLDHLENIPDKILKQEGHDGPVTLT